MRSFLATAACVVVVAVAGRDVGWAAPSPSQGVLPTVPADDAPRGLRYGQLQRSDTCHGQFAMRLAYGSVGCTHGPDTAPDGVDVRESAPVASVSAGAATALATMACQGDGVTGPRVQLVYAHASNVSDRYASLLSNFQLWAAQVDDVFNQSAAETGGTRHIRDVHDASCIPTVADVALSTTGDDSLTNTINELRSQGYNRSDRK